MTSHATWAPQDGRRPGAADLDSLHGQGAQGRAGSRAHRTPGRGQRQWRMALRNMPTAALPTWAWMAEPGATAPAAPAPEAQPHPGSVPTAMLRPGHQAVKRNALADWALASQAQGRKELAIALGVHPVWPSKR